MSDRPDIRGQMQPNTDFLHKIASLIPGYKGYVDREQRRDADKMLRMYVGRQYREQHSNLMRTQQQLARSHQFEAIGELDRLGGVLQRFIDKVETATYGYTGLFDPIKVEAAELDQIYAFDEALLDGVQQVGAAIAAVDAAARQGSGPRPGATASELPDINSALTQLSTVLDRLLTTWNHRQDLLISGQPMPADEFDRFRSAGAPTGPLPAGPGVPDTSAGATVPITGVETGSVTATSATGADATGGGTGSWGATPGQGEVTQRFDTQAPAQGGGWDSRTTGETANMDQGYPGNVARVDAGETPGPDDMGGMGGADMSRAGAAGGSSGAEVTEGNLGGNSGDKANGES